MNQFPALRPAQSVAAAPIASSIRPLVSASWRRAALLGSLALVGSAGTAMAQDASTVTAKQADAHTLLLTVENPTKQRLQMKVVSQAQHACLLNKVTHQASYGSTLSFNNLPAGNYAVLLRVGNERYRYDVQVAGQPQTTIVVPGLTPAIASKAVALATR